MKHAMRTLRGMSESMPCDCRRLALVVQEATATEQLADVLAVLQRVSAEVQTCESAVSRDLSAAHALGALALERLRRAHSRPLSEMCERRIAVAAEGLTAGERRVAALAAAGLTNREIAHVLFVTVKAVQWHLRHIYRKLEIRSRTEIAEFVPADRDAQPASPASLNPRRGA